MEYLILIWSSTKATKEDAKKLANGVKILSKGSKASINVVKMTDTWWGIVGDEGAKKALETLKQMA